MIELSTVIVAILCGLAYRYIVYKQEDTYPGMAVGAQDHSPMPETKYIQPLEAREYNASVFQSMPGSGQQVGAFSQRVTYL
jgi:hypothetical protein